MRLNLTQHKSTPEQGCEEPHNKGLIQDLLTFNEVPTKEEIEKRAASLANIAADAGADSVMIGGAPFLMPTLEIMLANKGIMPMYAFTRREVEEHDGLKKSVFRHVGFVSARPEEVIASCRNLRPGAGGITRVTMDGRIKYQAISHHPWKDRDYPEQDLGPCHPEALTIQKKACRIIGRINKEAAAEKKASAQTRQEWLSGLPNKIEIPWSNGQGFDSVEIDRESGNVTLGWNHLCTLPLKPVPDIVKWIQENTYVEE